MEPEPEPAQRRFARVALDLGLEVFDPELGTKLGDLADLSPSGTLIHSPRPFTGGETRRFELRVPGLEPSAGAVFEARCRWSELRVLPEACVNASGWEFTDAVSLAARASLVKAVASQMKRRRA
jgi:hypothetical protein